VKVSTPSRGSADTPRAHYALAPSATEWVVSIATIAAADQRGEPRPDTPWPQAGQFVDDYSVRIDDLFAPDDRRLTGRKEASGLLDAAWDARILTGPNGRSCCPCSVPCTSSPCNPVRACYCWPNRRQPTRQWPVTLNPARRPPSRSCGTSSPGRTPC
jgi:hypothetical protein